MTTNSASLHDLSACLIMKGRFDASVRRAGGAGQIRRRALEFDRCRRIGLDRGNELLQLVSGVVAHVAVGFELVIEHVIMKADKDTTLRLSDVDLVAVVVKFERGAVGLKRAFVGEF